MLTFNPDLFQLEKKFGLPNEPYNEEELEDIHAVNYGLKVRYGTEPISLDEIQTARIYNQILNLSLIHI